MKTQNIMFFPSDWIRLKEKETPKNLIFYLTKQDKHRLCKDLKFWSKVKFCKFLFHETSFEKVR